MRYCRSRIFSNSGELCGPRHRTRTHQARRVAAMLAEQRTALVTGGSGGLGEAIARALHPAGHTVLIVHSPGNASIGAWLEAQAGEGYNFIAYGANVADHASCQELAGLIQADGHHIDILVNNAGITRDATFRKLSYTDWDAVLRVNLDSVFNVTRPFIAGSPGYLDTKMVTSMAEDVVKQVVAGIPVGRLGRPEEVAALVAFIASESAGF